MGAHFYGGAVPSRGQRLQSKVTKGGRPMAVERLDALLSGEPPERGDPPEREEDRALVARLIPDAALARRHLDVLEAHADALTHTVETTGKSEAALAALNFACRTLRHLLRDLPAPGRRT